MKELCVEEEGQPERYHPWDGATQKLFAMDEEDIEWLLSGNVLWRQGTAFTLEEPEVDAL